MRINFIWIGLTVCFLFTPPVHAQNTSIHCDFESGTVGEAPEGWTIAPDEGYHAQLVGKNPKQGEQCVHVYKKDEDKVYQFGNLMRSLDAAPYQGKVVRMRAAVRVEPEDQDDRAQLWFRVDRPGGELGFFDNMDDRPIRSGEWAHYEITGEIAHDAVIIYYGLLLISKGDAWLDDLSIEIMEDIAASRPPAPLAGRSLQNMIAFARLCGYVRHFHPSDEAAEADWNAFIVNGVELVEAAGNADELLDSLNTLFNPMAPSVQIHLTGEKTPNPEDVHPADHSGLGRVAWRHSGYGQSNSMGIYTSERIRAKDKDDASWLERLKGIKEFSDLPDPFKPFEADLGGGVSCSIPLTVFYDDEGTLPRAFDSSGESAPSTKRIYTGMDRSTRLANVILAWNIFQHFYPYFDVVETDWNSILAGTLEDAALDEDEQEFLETLRRMVARLYDGHGSVRGPQSGERVAGLPFLWDWIEGGLVVTQVAQDETEYEVDLKPGDVVLSINKKPAAQVLTEAERLIASATPQFMRYNALRKIRYGPMDEEVTLEVQRGTDNSRKEVLVRRSYRNWVGEPRPPKVHEVKPGIFYLDVDRISDNDFMEVLPKLEEAKGIIFDFRGYPRSLSPWTFFPHLIDQTVFSQQWHVPMVRYPDRQNLTFDRSGEWTIVPKAPYLEAKRAFITDGRAISYAESCMGIVEHYKLGEIVGGPTAGTNGNINPFELPGGYRIVWTGMKVLKHDGSQHHGIGILPTIPVSRTIKGVAEGRDELLERAIEAVM